MLTPRVLSLGSTRPRGDPRRPLCVRHVIEHPPVIQIISEKEFMNVRSVPGPDSIRHTDDEQKASLCLEQSFPTSAVVVF